MQHIVVVESGWVFVGNIQKSTKQNSKEVVIENASVIREWGTDRGLGQLALSGCTKTTILDPCHEARVVANKVLFTIPCKVELK